MINSDIEILGSFSSKNLNNLKNDQAEKTKIKIQAIEEFKKRTDANLQQIDELITELKLSFEVLTMVLES